MSEKEKAIVEKLKDTIPKMSEQQKGYLLGMVESMADRERSEPNKEKQGKEQPVDEKKRHISEILCQQIELLAEESKKTNDVDVKIRIAGEIDRMADTILNIYDE